MVGVPTTAAATTGASDASAMNSATDVLHARPTFASIVCGVDGSEASFEAA
jgi:hypothetical protein